MSSSGVLGRMIALPPPSIIWLRCVIACVGMLIFFRLIGKTLPPLKGRVRVMIIVAGILFGLHWITYFYALQYATVAIGMLSLFTYPIFTVLLEPLILRTKLNWVHLPVSALAFVGMYLLVPEFSLDNDYSVGILFGVVSSLLYALRNMIMKQRIQQFSGDILMFYQMLTVAALSWPALFILPVQMTDVVVHWKELVVLGLFTSAFGHSLFVGSFRHFSVTTVSILSNLTPLFGILLGLLILHEVPQGNVIAGGSLILFTAMIEVWMHRRKR